MKFKSEKNIYALVLIAAVVVFVLVNTFFSALSRRFSLRLDTTDNELYKLSLTTAELCAGITDSTDIFVIAAESDYPVMFREILGSYGKLSEKLNIEYIDPYSEPVFLETWQQKGVTLEENDILVSGSKGVKQLAYTDLLVYSGENITGIQAEQRISSALSYVNSDEAKRVVFVAGHNERPSASLTAVFTDANCVLDTDSAENLGDAALAVIAAPTRDYTEGEIAAVSAFLAGGGKLLILLEPGSGEMPNLASLLSAWNIELSDGVVSDERYCIGGNPLNVMPVYTTHEIDKFFETNQYAMVVPSCRALDIGRASADAETVPLLISSPKSVRSDTLEEGSFKLALVSEKETAEGTAAVVAVGSRLVCGDDVMGASSYANRDFFSECAKYLLGADTSLSIAPKSLDAQPLVINAAQTNLFTVLYIIALPLVCFIAGAAVFIKRRKL